MKDNKLWNEYKRNQIRMFGRMSIKEYRQLEKRQKELWKKINGGGR